MPGNRQNSRSDEQQSVEPLILEKVNVLFNLNLLPKNGILLGRAKANFDGIDHERSAVSEIYAHVGYLRGSQPDKVIDDISKMLLLEKIAGGSWTKLIVFQDEKAASGFSEQSNSRAAELCRQFGITVVVIDLGSETRDRVSAAQERQHMSNTMAS